MYMRNKTVSLIGAVKVSHKHEVAGSETGEGEIKGK